MSNTIDTSVTTTEVPAFNVSFFMRLEKAVGEDVVITKDHVTDAAEFKNFTDRCLTVSTFQNDLYLGKGADVISRTQQMRPGDNDADLVLKRVYDYGNSSTKYQLGDYPENKKSDGTTKITSDKNSIGSHNAHFIDTGVVNFLNANVAYENSNGFNFTVESNLLAFADKLESNTNTAHKLETGDSLKAYIVVTAKNDNDVLGKVQTDMTDLTQASTISNGSLNAKTNTQVISVEHLTIRSIDASNNRTSDFSFTPAGTNAQPIIRPLSYNIICDIYRSRDTTLVGNVIVLNRLPRIEDIQKNIIDGAAADVNFPIDSHENINDNFIILTRITEKSLTTTLYDQLHSTDTDKKAKTVTKYDGDYELALNELNGANAYNIADMHKVIALDEAKCGHAGLHVEYQVIASGLLARTLQNRENSLDNIYWEVNIPDAGGFSDVPGSIGGSGSGQLNMFAYRKGLSVSIFDSLAIEKNKFISDIVNAEVPKSWELPNETYEGYPMVEIISKFGLDLYGMVQSTSNTDIKFPILYKKNMSSSNSSEVESYEFVSMNYFAGQTANKYDKISASFVHNWIPRSNFDDVLAKCGVEVGPSNEAAQIAAWRGFAKDFITEAKEKGFAPAGYLSTLDSKLSGTDPLTPIQQFSTLMIEALYSLTRQSANSVNPTRIFVRPTKTISAGTYVFKNNIDKQSVATNLNVERLPINLLMEATSLGVREVAVSNIANLRDKILAEVGNAMQLLIPIVLELNTGKVEVTGEKKYELVTNFLVECLSKLSLTEIMNNIWYYKDSTSGERKVLLRKDTNAVNGEFYTNKYIKIETPPSSYQTDGQSNELDRLIYTKVWGQPDTTGSSATIHTMVDIINDSQCRMRLAGVKEDPTARGALKDYRYPGAGTGIYAENVPNVSGGFALQVLQWMACGLVNIPSAYDSLFNNKEDIFNAIRNNSYISDVNGDLGTVSENPMARLKIALEDTTLEPLQHVLDYIQANDGARFVINEKEADDIRASSGGLDIKRQTTQNGTTLEHENAYMLPLIEQDLLSFVSTVNGSMEDPGESVKSSYTAAIADMIKKLDQPTVLNPQPDVDGITHSTMALTGHALNEDGSEGDVGLYTNAVNLFIKPDIGPYEKTLTTTPEADKALYQIFGEKSWEIRMGLHNDQMMDTYEIIRSDQLSANQNNSNITMVHHHLIQ